MIIFCPSDKFQFENDPYFSYFELRQILQLPSSSSTSQFCTWADNYHNISQFWVLSAKLLTSVIYITGFYATTQMIALTLTLYTIEKKLYGEQPNSVACVVIVFLVSSPRLTNNTLNSSSNFRQEHPGKNNPQMHGLTSLSPLCSLPLFWSHIHIVAIWTFTFQKKLSIVRVKLPSPFHYYASMTVKLMTLVQGRRMVWESEGAISN